MILKYMLAEEHAASKQSSNFMVDGEPEEA